VVTPRRIDRMRELLARRQADLRLFLDDVHDPYNHSAILRTCDAMGLLYVDYARLGDHPVRPRKTVVQGSDRWLVVRQIPYAARVARLLEWKKAGYQVVAATLSEASVYYTEVDFTRPTVLVMGNEKEGVSDDVARIAESRIVIPMHGMAQSLNVSVATAVILSEAERQRREAGMYARPSLDEEEAEALLQVWLLREGLLKRSRGRVDINKYETKEKPWPDCPTM
jgi:tRNA (guanosine-2'-O-)-methyltransferase